MDYYAWRAAGRSQSSFIDSDGDGFGDLHDWSGAEWCYECPFTLSWRYNGMIMRSCTDECVADLTFRYHDNSTFQLEGSLFLSEE